jgi:hypothetical protein
MFEKEAVEYENEYGQDAFTQFNMPQWIEPVRMERKLGFQKGAIFGYNKANEWHKQEVDDIYDLISKDWSVRYFICIMKDKSRVTAIGNCDEDNNGGVSVNLFFEHDDEKYYIDDIVWWKEIVLPKEDE